MVEKGKVVNGIRTIHNLTNRSVSLNKNLFFAHSAKYFAFSALKALNLPAVGRRKEKN